MNDFINIWDTIGLAIRLRAVQNVPCTLNILKKYYPDN